MHFDIVTPDASPRSQIQHRIDRKTKPVGALGRLESLALQIALIQQPEAPAIRSPQMLVFAGDHGAAKAGVSAYPQDVTWQMVENFLAGGAAINVFCREAGMGLRVVDAGVAHDFGVRDALIDAKIGPGTENWLEAPAMSLNQVERALQRGRTLAHELADHGSNLLGFGEMGIGNTASASLITHCLTGARLEQVTGRGTGLDDSGLARKLAMLEQAVARGGRPSEALKVLSEYGGFEIAMMAGAMLGAAEKRMVLLIDGFIVTAALLAAHRIAPEILSYCVFAHRSEEPGHAVQHTHLGVEPLMALDLRLGEGTGAALALPLVRAAVGFYNDMASFESAGVDG
ncbi:nicotinate-nucleotide--dimethylbenzimidazole phosphoribosyltransferase [Azoarcus taiwanensis]|uniref:Nicotinate-nucleotide--dimethylbenzimidazole phosphoribosyltransferase n=1 Tax=Azoarcus taiwanensis TaxID=666964 RepID=A0A972J8G0_9RHOO|nr:nicotinate-nucleotide--dimethylbenzimidazole phosphoribosyltransferase [Azoarcus taiwanensis]NMG03519.1 nicotinate-nucleotide--dimethylbenzimidazole phosphoribosyltransferase [Azoarcus taiwanensis]